MSAAAATPPIVTGVDGSVESLDAVRWAARTAHLHGAPLEIVYALDFPALLAGGVIPPPGEMKEVLRVRGRRYLVPRRNPPRHKASRTASLLVVGSSGHGKLTGLLAGSVASAAGAHAACDTVVVRGDTWDEPGAAERPVVAGVDGGEASARILATALAEARARHAPLVVIHAAADEPQAREPDRAALADAGHRLPADRLRDLDTEGVTVEEVVVQSHARRELIERSTTAQLVVLGTRGRGGFPGLLLGSTGQALLHNAACPVHLVRGA
ncbi:Universal stress protein family [Amycolatopsis camponoti]|uniref:Universal stress protein family n=1 Tax=Amycolatopsis camponoti TaxID=2606593 RepID=A0A6I8M173_9PSEU|nr:universal stress protein [Amycolatopsis camponoti]VVJ21695.1 Universal stress protein family [Amycolatopsis camponoti]